MAGRIARLLNRQTLERPELVAASEQLAALAEARPDLRAAAAIQAAILKAIYAAPAPVQTVTINAEQAAARLADGQPLLRNVPLPLAEHDLRTVFVRVCAAAGRAAEHPAPYTSLAETARKGRLGLGSMGATLLAGAGAMLAVQLEEQGQQADLVLTLLRLALLPFLEQVARQLAPLREGRPWQHGYCPTCGAWPVLAEQRGLEQFRYLRCGLCACSWEVDRILCAFCGNRDYTTLGYLQVEGEEQKQRAATCDACQSYLKLRSTLTPLTTPQLLVEELALVHLDLIAIEKGYGPPE